MAQTITLTDHRYDPDEIHIDHGETLNVINATNEAHTLTADDGSFDTGEVGPGEEVALEVTSDVAVGANSFHCSYHSDMRGTLVVSLPED